MAEPDERKPTPLLDALRQHPKNRTYGDVAAALGESGYSKVRSKGSHEAWKKDKSLLTIVRLHGRGDKTYLTSFVKRLVRSIEEAEEEL